MAIHNSCKWADLTLGVRLSFLPPLPLQVSVIMLQRLNNKIGFLPLGNILRNELGYSLVTKRRLFLLVWFFFLHNGLDNLGVELSLLHKLLHFDCLCK